MTENMKFDNDGSERGGDGRSGSSTLFVNALCQIYMELSKIRILLALRIYHSDDILQYSDKRFASVMQNFSQICT